MSFVFELSNTQVTSVVIAEDKDEQVKLEGDSKDDDKSADQVEAESEKVDSSRERETRQKALVGLTAS